MDCVPRLQDSGLARTARAPTWVKLRPSVDSRENLLKPGGKRKGDSDRQASGFPSRPCREWVVHPRPWGVGACPLGRGGWAVGPPSRSQRAGLERWIPRTSARTEFVSLAALGSVCLDPAGRAESAAERHLLTPASAPSPSPYPALAGAGRGQERRREERRPFNEGSLHARPRAQRLLLPIRALPTLRLAGVCMEGTGEKNSLHVGVVAPPSPPGPWFPQ